MTFIPTSVTRQSQSGTRGVRRQLSPSLHLPDEYSVGNTQWGMRTGEYSLGNTHRHYRNINTRRWCTQVSRPRNDENKVERHATTTWSSGKMDLCWCSIVADASIQCVRELSGQRIAANPVYIGNQMHEALFQFWGLIPLFCDCQQRIAAVHGQGRNQK